MNRNPRKRKFILAGSFALAGAAYGNLYEWIGGIAPANWDDASKWECIPIGGSLCDINPTYPDSGNDDATISQPMALGQELVISLSTLTIDALELDEEEPGTFLGVSFESKDAANTLTCDSVRISGLSVPVKLVVRDNATLRTTP
jgi:hypothetical protein